MDRLQRPDNTARQAEPAAEAPAQAPLRVPPPVPDEQVAVEANETIQQMAKLRCEWGLLCIPARNHGVKECADRLEAVISEYNTLKTRLDEIDAQTPGLLNREAIDKSLQESHQAGMKAWSDHVESERQKAEAAEANKTGFDKLKDLATSALRSVPRIIESLEYLIVGNLVQIGSGIVGAVRLENPLTAARDGGAAYIESRRAWYNEHIYGGSLFGTDSEFSSLTSTQAALRLNPIGHAAEATISPALELAHLGYDEAARGIVNLGGADMSYPEFKKYQQEDSLLKWGERSFEVAEGAASLAVMLATGGVSTAGQLGRASRALGVAGGFGAAGAVSQELLSGEDFNLERFLDNTLSGTSSSLLFMGAMSTVGKGYVRVRTGGTAMPATQAELASVLESSPEKIARLQQAMKESEVLRDVVDFVDSQSDFGDALGTFENVQNLRMFAGALLNLGVASTDAFDLKLAGVFPGGGTGGVSQDELSRAAAGSLNMPPIPGIELSNNGKVLYVSSTADVRALYGEQRTRSNSPGALPDASTNVYAYYDNALGVLVAARPGEQSTSAEKAAWSSLVVYEFRLRQGASEETARRAQSDYLSARGLSLEQQEGSFTIRDGAQYVPAADTAVLPPPAAAAVPASVSALVFPDRRSMSAERNGSPPAATPVPPPASTPEPNSDGTDPSQPAASNPSNSRLPKDVKNDLKNGILPQELLASFNIVDPASDVSTKFQTEMEKLFRAMYPEETVMPRFFLSANEDVNAAYLIGSVPPMLVFNRGCFYGDNPLTLSEVAAVMGHEWGHHRIRQQYGTEANSKLEEGLADVYALDDLKRLGIDARTYYGLLNKLDSEYTYIDVIDPHPSPGTRFAIVEGWLTNEYNQGRDLAAASAEQIAGPLDFSFLSAAPEVPVAPQVASRVILGSHRLDRIFKLAVLRAEGREEDYDDDDVDVTYDVENHVVEDPRMFEEVIDAISRSTEVFESDFETFVQHLSFKLTAEETLRLSTMLTAAYDLHADRSKQHSLILLGAALLRQGGRDVLFPEIEGFHDNPTAETAQALIAALRRNPILLASIDFDSERLFSEHNILDLCSAAGRDSNPDLAQCLRLFGVEDIRFKKHASSDLELFLGAYLAAEDRKALSRDQFLDSGFRSHHETLALQALSDAYRANPDAFDRACEERLLAAAAFGESELHIERSRIADDHHRLGRTNILFPDLFDSSPETFVTLNIPFIRNATTTSQVRENLCDFFETRMTTPEDRQRCKAAVLKMISHSLDAAVLGDDPTLFDDSRLLTFVLQNTVGAGGGDVFTQRDALSIIGDSKIMQAEDGYSSGFSAADCSEVLDTLVPLIDIEGFYDLGPLERIRAVCAADFGSKAADDTARWVAEFETRRLLARKELTNERMHEALAAHAFTPELLGRLVEKGDFTIDDIGRATRPFTVPELSELYNRFDTAEIRSRLSSREIITFCEILQSKAELEEAEAQIAEAVREINLLPDLALRQELCSVLAQNKNLSIRRLGTRQALVETWSDAAAAELGIDDGSAEYFARATAVVDRLVQTSPRNIRKLLLDSLATKTVSQEALTDHIRTHDAQRLRTSDFTETAKTQITVDFSRMFLSENTNDRMLLLNYLINATNDYTTGTVIGAIVSHGFAHNIAVRDGLSDEQIRQELAILRDSFWDLPMEARLLAAAQLLVPSNGRPMPKSEWKEAKNFVLNHLVQYGRLSTESARAFLNSYLDSFPAEIPGVRRNALGAVLAAAETVTTDTGVSSEIDGLCTVIELMGPAETKAGQAAAGHPLTDDEYKRRLARLKNRASEPSRPELFSWITDQVPQEVRDQITYYGPVVGSGSLFVSVEVHTAEGRCVLQIMRPDALGRATRGFERIEAAIAGTPLTEEQKLYLQELVRQGRQDITAETDVRLSRQQADIFAALYNGSEATVRTETGGTETFRFAAAELLSFGDAYRLLRYVPGEHFVEIERGERKTNIAIAMLAFELSNILSGGYFDKDAHGGNVKIDGNTIYRFDSGAVTLTPPSAEDLAQLTMLITRTMAGSTSETASTDFVERFFQEVRKLRQDQGSVAPVVGETQRALLALGDYYSELSGQDLLDVMKAVYTNAHPDIKSAIASQYMTEATQTVSGWFNTMRAALHGLVALPPISIKRQTLVDRP